MSCRDDAQAPFQEQLGHKEARRPQVSWIDPSYCVQPHQDFQLVRESSGNVVEHLHHEMQVQEEETGQLTTIKVEKTRWVTTSRSSEGHIMAISRLSTCLTWAQASPAAPPWIDPCQPPPCQQSPCQQSPCQTSPCQPPTCQPPPPSSWSSDQDLSVSSLETENSSLP